MRRLSAVFRAHWFALGLFLATALTHAATRDPLVLVERVVDTRYGQTLQANEDLSKDLSSSLRFSHTVKPGETLQGIANSLFGVNPINSPSTYNKLEFAIKASNGVKDVDLLRAGQTLLLPYLPHKRRATPGAPAPPTARVPAIGLGPARDEILSGRAYDFARGATKVAPQVTNVEGGQATSPLVRQLMWVPASTVRGDSSLTVIAQPIHVRFHASSAGTNDDLSHDISVLRQAAASQPTAHESVVYILDDSWPDAESFTQSIEFLHHADATIRERYHLGTANWPDSLIAPGATTTFPWQGNGTTSHAAEIKASLQPFMAVSTAVQLVYVPLFTNQTGASDVLSELILVTQIAQAKQSQLEISLPDAALASITARASAVRDQIMRSLPAHQADQPADTDQAVITALLNFAQLYAQATGQPFFFNTSWVVDQYEFVFGPPPNLLGVTLAAAGDNPSIDIFTSNVLLASRAQPYPGDVIAIMNDHPDGSRGGCTSYWTSAGTNPIYGLTYDGFVSSSLCGTSFSAPRVAWMLAFRESRKPLVSDPQAQRQWFGSYRNFILSLQDSTKSQDLKYWVSPGTVMQKPGP